MSVYLHKTLSQTAGVLTQAFLKLGYELLALRRAKAAKEMACNSVGHYAVRMLGMPARIAAELLKVAEKLEVLPHLREAAREGRISWYALQLLVDYATPESDAHCVRLAGEYTIDDLRRVLQQVGAELNPGLQPKVVVHWKLDVRTLVLLEKALRKLSEEHQRRLSTNEGLQRMAALVLTGKSDAHAVQRSLDQVELDLLAELAQQPKPVAPSGQPIGPVRLQKVAELPGWENRRLRFNPHTRKLTEAQRAELLRREGYRCATPGCQNSLWLQVHHVDFWNQGGPTARHNLVVLCAACHRMIHRGDLGVEGVAPGGLEFRDRQGRLLRCFIPYSAAEWLQEFAVLFGPAPYETVVNEMLSVADIVTSAEPLCAAGRPPPG